MRRDNRKREENLKGAIYIAGGILGILIVTLVIVFISYANKVKKNSESSGFESSKITELVPNTSETESASKEIGKTVNEVKTELDNNITTQNNIPIEENTNTIDNSNITEITITETNEEEENLEEKVEFFYPVDGEIIKEYAKDNLLYSETLQEWVTHTGIDIAADKTSVVKASCKGTVVGIKNDPRYGLTVIIEHNNGYKTVYSNLLTTEFVNEGDIVETGETIGTVGATATFEVAEQSHLHFEILKDNEYQDPTILLAKPVEEK